MKKLTSKEIRNIWLDFWASKKHEVVPSKSLIPVKDPSLLWINSGVATLKDYFSGKKIPANPRITNSQKAIRTNDIENVGETARHHTLFEMLGNFSIGEYFKKEALTWAYEFLFEVLKLEKEKIYITYYDEDKEAKETWLSLGIEEDHLIKGTYDTNFWDVGEGPCGPDTEIFYDRGEKYDPNNIGIKLLQEDLENDRYVEIWNIVFSQFNNDGENNYTELRQKNIDTGAGLERIVSIFQDAPTNFDTDLFLPIIREIEKMTDKVYKIENYFEEKNEQTKINKHFKVMADHIRAISQAINDGATPSNTKRGYIIRRLLRRAYRSGKQLGIKEDAFIYKLIPICAEVLDVYPIDIENVQKIVKKEELAFAKTIHKGEELLLKSIKGKNELEFSIAFKLFETYGFPIELTKEILEEKNIDLDLSKFEEFKKKHAMTSRGNKVTKGMQQQIQIIQDVKEKISDFIGYSELTSESKVVFVGEEKGKYYVLLDKTPFYATSGGQQHDEGTIDDIVVQDVFKDGYGNHWHILLEKPENKLVKASVDEIKRALKAKNHSGTHALGYAMRKAIGKDIIQLGSENNENRLRFDFPLDHKLTEEEIEHVEETVKEFISERIDREYILDTFENGINMGALALEGEIDSDPNKMSRIVKFGPSIEFCGGTHVSNTGVIEDFKIVKVESKGSGTYRIEAITSFETIKLYNKNLLISLIQNANDVINKIKKFKEIDEIKIPENKILDESSFNFNKEIKTLKHKIISLKDELKQISKSTKKVEIDFNVDFVEWNGYQAFIKLDANPKDVKTLAIKLRDEYKDALIIIASPLNDKSMLAIASNKYNSKEVFDVIANKHQGNGGGNEKFAMGKTNLIESL